MLDSSKGLDATNVGTGLWLVAILVGVAIALFGSDDSAVWMRRADPVTPAMAVSWGRILARNCVVALVIASGVLTRGVTTLIFASSNGVFFGAAVFPGVTMRFSDQIPLLSLVIGTELLAYAICTVVGLAGSEHVRVGPSLRSIQWVGVSALVLILLTVGAIAEHEMLYS